MDIFWHRIFFSSISYPRFRTRNCFFWKIIMSGTCSYQHEISKPDSPHTKINHLRGATTVERWPVTSWEWNRKLGIYTGISNFSNDWVIWVAGILRDTDILPYRLSWWYRDSMARAILYYQWHLNWGSVIQDIQVSSLRSRWHRTVRRTFHHFLKLVSQSQCCSLIVWQVWIDCYWLILEIFFFMSFVSPVSPDDQAALKSNEPISTKSLKAWCGSHDSEFLRHLFCKLCVRVK